MEDHALASGARRILVVSSLSRAIALSVLLTIASLYGSTAKGVSTKQTPAREYDFRGAALGMSLAQLRASAFPDASWQPRAKLFCSSDKESKNSSTGIWFYLEDDAEKAVGVIQCEYFRPQSFFLHSWEKADMVVGGGSAKHIIYAFVPDPHDHVVRLYSISVHADTGGASSAMEGLREKFGAPTTSTSDVIQNRMGAKFDHTLAMWANPLSTIFFENPSGDVDTMAIIYSETRLSGFVEHMTKTIIGPSSRRM